MTSSPFTKVTGRCTASIFFALVLMALLLIAVNVLDLTALLNNLITSILLFVKIQNVQPYLGAFLLLSLFLLTCRVTEWSEQRRLRKER